MQPTERRADRSGSGRVRSRAVGVLLVAVGVVLSACGSAPKRRAVRIDDALADPRAADRLAGAVGAGRACCREQVPALVELLDDPDPAVRLGAGTALRDLTGHDTGYQPWADPETRRAHRAAWRRWCAGQSPRPVLVLPLRRAPSPSPPPLPPPAAASRPAPSPPAPGAAAGSALPAPEVRIVERRR